MPLPVTAATALILGTLMLALTVNVIIGRRRGRIAHGDGGDKAMLKRIRGQANAAEQVPVALILLGLLEHAGAGGGWLSVIAGLLIAGRVSHGVYFGAHGFHFRWRTIGMSLTLAAQILLLGTLALMLSGV